MTQGRQRQQQQQGQPRDNDGIYSQFTGLNTITTPLNTGSSDSPDMVNTLVSQKGAIRKRGGTRELLTQTGVSNLSGVTLIPFTMKSGRTILCAKENLALKIYDLAIDSVTGYDELVLLMTKSNVFSTNADSVRLDYVTTSEIEPRIIMTSGTNVPIQLSILENSGSVTSSTTYTIEDTRYEFATSSNISVWVGGVLVTPQNVSYSSGTLTITFSSSQTGIVNVLFVTWQWWAEAIQLDGDMVSNTTTRFHISKTDQNLEIPVRLLLGIEELSYGNYPIRVRSSSAYSTNVYSFASDRIPDAAGGNEYAFSVGGRYDSSVGDEILPGISFVTFGDIYPEVGGVPDDPTPAIFIRGYDLTFNGGEGQSGNNLRVLVDGVLATQNLNAASSSGTQTSNPTYYLRNDSYSVITSGSTVGTYITFDSTATVGQASTAFIEIINSEVNTQHIGTSATSELDAFRDGALIPAYGLGTFANYSVGSFPRTVAVYQGRLVFAGFPTQAMTLVASNVFDSTKRGTFFNNFQTTLSESSALDAVDALLTNTLDDAITNLEEFQNSLFVWTKQALFRVHGGEQGSISPSNFFLNFIASLGAVNPQSVVKVDKTILFLSSSGVFDITPTLEAGDFTASERSLRIRNLLSADSTPFNEAISWLTYDATRQEVYVAVSRATQFYAAQSLYVYSLLRDAWTEYKQPSGVFLSFHGTVSYTSINTSRVIIATTSWNSYPAAPNSISYVRLNDFYPMDNIKVEVHDGVDTSCLSASLAKRVQYETQEWQLEYFTTIEDSGQEGGFQLSPITDVQDVRVTWNGEVLTFGTDYVKTDRSSIVFLVRPRNNPISPLPNLTIEYVLPSDGESAPLCVLRDGVLLHEQEGDYSVSYDSGTGKYEITWATVPEENAVIIYGDIYEAHYRTQLFTRNTLAEGKRLKHFYAYFDNEVASQTYRVSEVNTTSSQDVEELIGTYKVRAGVNVAYIYDDTNDGTLSYDLYGFSELYWDVALFDIFPSAKQSKRYARISEPVIGVSYGFQAYIWSMDCSTFELVGYQITTRAIAPNSRHWSD